MAKAPRRPKRQGFSRRVTEIPLDLIQAKVMHRLDKHQEGWKRETPRLAEVDLFGLSRVLVELGEDIHCGLGLWRALETYQEGFFGTPLPFMVAPGTQLPPDRIAPERVQQLAWVWLGQVLGRADFPPDDRNLVRLAAEVAEVLRSEFAPFRRESPIQEFLSTPNTHGWDVKAKLIWLGRDSYLFREFATLRLADRLAGKLDSATTIEKVPIIDDFLNEGTTGWAGLGPLDLLAGVLPLGPERRADLLSWHARHQAIYRVLDDRRDEIRVLNLINDQEYRVPINIDPHPFRRGECVKGILVPWDGAWYWSGTQQRYPKLGKADLKRLREQFRLMPDLFYRLEPAQLDQARQITRRMYDQFVLRHGKDWTVFADGRALAADWRAANEASVAQAATARPEGLGKQRPRPAESLGIPREIAEQAGPIAVHFNPEEGQEIIPHFEVVRSGLARRGVGLEPVEVEALRALLEDQAISPGFVRRLADEFGPESVAAAFDFPRPSPASTLDYLLRRCKGRYYRTRYPSLTLVDA